MNSELKFREAIEIMRSLYLTQSMNAIKIMVKRCCDILVLLVSSSSDVEFVVYMT